MPAFLANMMNANQNVICTAKGNAVRRVSVTDLLSHRLRIPIFQRRYCWDSDQWETLLNDALVVASGSKEKHALGRITCVQIEGEDARLLVIDGQQRNTTCTLLLAAIRDVALERYAGDSLSDELVLKLDSMLFPDSAGLATWLAQNTGSKQLADGVALEFAALVPTYCDRASYFASILPAHAAAASGSAQWQRPSEAKAFFVDKLSEFSLDRLVSLAEVVLERFEWLFFPLDMSGNHQDGTEDLQVIYERLAVRDATFCRPRRATEFASMGAADFVRNLLLGSFRFEDKAIGMYKNHWLPIEQEAAAASIRDRNSDIASVLEAMLNNFLKVQPEKLSEKRLSAAVVIGGELYPRFRRWLTAALTADVSVVNGEGEADALERKTATLLRRLQGFAADFLANNSVNAENLKAAPTPGTRSSTGCASAKWRCTRCLFPNTSQSTMCTACNLTRS
jgi:hypothetical protein